MELHTRHLLSSKVMVAKGMELVLTRMNSKSEDRGEGKWNMPVIGLPGEVLSYE